MITVTDVGCGLWAVGVFVMARPVCSTSMSQQPLGAPSQLTRATAARTTAPTAIRAHNNGTTATATHNMLVHQEMYEPPPAPHVHNNQGYVGAYAPICDLLFLVRGLVCQFWMLSSRTQ